MIVWLASFPRSGNTLLRIALNRIYGARSSVVYDHDGVAARLGSDLVGLEALSQGNARDGRLRFVKTHRQRDGKVADEDAVIYLVRDGRDALVSYARLLSEDEPAGYEAKLEELIGQDCPTGTGGWGANVLSWLQAPLEKCEVIRFEALARGPAEALRRAVPRIAPTLQAIDEVCIPSFEELAALDAGFFRRGNPGAWREEMPPRLHDLFWSRADNRAAMGLLGYS